MAESGIGCRDIQPIEGIVQQIDPFGRVFIFGIFSYYSYLQHVNLAFDVSSCRFIHR